ncbi:DUF2147 domain-containing protein [Yoonia sp. SS1-5]|uniref:DUF2147 domain-containing protein n=1 Tax=Yoonia rhodophyticola TaxID=3137370 RepID=A0AAN0NKP0_9RHOB
MTMERRTVASCAVFALIFGVAMPSSAWSETLRGTFASPGMAIVVQFDRCDDNTDTICGTLVWSWEGEDELSVPFGTVIAPALRQTDRGWEGHLTDPDSGRMFRGTVVRAGRDQLILRGCAGPFCTTERWYSLASIQTVIENLRGRDR